MFATIIKGTAVADAWLTDIAAQVRALGAPVHLAVLQAGDDAGSRAFVRAKQKAAQSVGMIFSSYVFDRDDEAGLRATLEFLAGDEDVHGIVVQLPLPDGWNTDALVALIPRAKDADALTRSASVLAPAAAAVRRVLEVHGIASAGLRAAVVGQGRLVGIPVAAWLRQAGAIVEVVDIATPHPAATAVQADLVVSGVGVPKLLTDAWVKSGATVLDFGYCDGLGDVDSASVKEKAGLLSPVPGGMGPLVVAALLENVLTLTTSNS